MTHERLCPKTAKMAPAIDFNALPSRIRLVTIERRGSDRGTAIAAIRLISATMGAPTDLYLKRHRVTAMSNRLIALRVYTLRDAVQADIVGTLRAVAELGYTAPFSCTRSAALSAADLLTELIRSASGSPACISASIGSSRTSTPRSPRSTRSAAGM